MRDRARAVVVGGGVGGCGILYWLARLGWSDVLLVERADLTSGSTFHSAGLVGQLRGSISLTKMMMSSVDLYRTLEAEVGLETGWREVGSLRLGSSQERMEELARPARWGKTFGLPRALVRVPSLADMEVVRLINGPEAFTPDGEFILGPTSVRGFWVAAGFCAHGLAGAGGMGKLVAEWLLEGVPSPDGWGMG